MNLDRDSRILVAGLGYVGLPLALGAAAAGLDVLGVDISAQLVERLIQEVRPIPKNQLGDLVFTTEYPGAGTWDIAVITVPTPLTSDRRPDLDAVRAAGAAVGRSLSRDCLVILESTSYPGTTREVLVPILESNSGLKAGKDFLVAFSPERVDPGNSTWGLQNTPKVLGGLDQVATSRASAFYRRFIDEVVAVSSPEVAEFSKLLENTFRHVNIALVNDMAISAHEMGIDIWEVIAAASTKPFGFQRFTPGPGVGGHCIPIDPAYLAWRIETSLSRPSRFIDLAGEVNDRMPGYVAQRLLIRANAQGRVLSGANVGVFGLAYKPDVGDVRESPGLRVADSLARLGSQVFLIDPNVDETFSSDYPLVAWDKAEETQFDFAVITTPHREFVEAAQFWQKIPGGVLDTHGALPVMEGIERL